MKKNITFFCLMLFSGICFAQELTTNKTQTIALLNNEFSKVNGKIIKYDEGNVTVKNSRVSFERGMLTITQSYFENDKMSSTKSYYFSPLDFDGVVDGSKDYKEKVTTKLVMYEFLAINTRSYTGKIRFFQKLKKL
ncbi:hypothetical protein [Halpernia sp. GG3]